MVVRLAEKANWQFKGGDRGIHTTPLRFPHRGVGQARGAPPFTMILEGRHSHEFISHRASSEDGIDLYGIDFFPPGIVIIIDQERSDKKYIGVEAYQ